MLRKGVGGEREGIKNPLIVYSNCSKVVSRATCVP